MPRLKRRRVIVDATILCRAAGNDRGNTHVYDNHHASSVLGSVSCRSMSRSSVL